MCLSIEAHLFAANLFFAIPLRFEISWIYWIFRQENECVKKYEIQLSFNCFRTTSVLSVIPINDVRKTFFAFVKKKLIVDYKNSLFRFFFAIFAI